MSIMDGFNFWLGKTLYDIGIFILVVVGGLSIMGICKWLSSSVEKDEAKKRVNKDK